MMNDSNVAPGQGSYTAYAWLLALVGVALVFSMPSATYVRELLASPLRRSSPTVFFAAYLVVFAMFGLNRGAAGVPLRIGAHQGVRTALFQVLFGQFLLSPYLIYVRIILLPSDQPAIALIAVYGLVVGLLCTFVGYTLEVWGTGRGIHTAVHRYTFGLVYFAAPLLALLLEEPIATAVVLSPYGFLSRVLDSPSPSELALAFTVPATAALLVWVVARRMVMRYQSV